jgi:hypothetical protein
LLVEIGLKPAGWVRACIVEYSEVECGACRKFVAGKPVAKCFVGLDGTLAVACVPSGIGEVVELLGG